jgi:hypothetical protein
LSTVIAVPEKGDVLAISIPRTEAHVIRHFQERMPYGLFVPDVLSVAELDGSGLLLWGSHTRRPSDSGKQMASRGHVRKENSERGPSP